MDSVLSYTKTKEFKAFVYGVIACVVGIFAAAAFTQSAITFTAHNAVTFTKITDGCSPCKCKSNDCCPAPVAPAVPATPHKRKTPDGVLGDLK